MDTTPSKAAKGPALNEDQWSCGKCGNLNFANRTVCNMRSCGAPKDSENWICPGCGNENHAHRVFCNMRRCQQIRPGATRQQVMQMEQAAVPSAGKGAGSYGKGFMAAPQSDVRAVEPGAWTCVCGNLNYPGRTVCNARSCGKPPPRQPKQPQYWSAPSYGYAPAYALAMRVAPTSGSSGPPPPGSWECVACQNVNFPTRDKCNAKNCGQPRHLVDGGAPSYSPPPPPQNSSAPPGSWTCPSCENLNYPTRTVCNKRGCGLAKPA